MFEIVRRHTKLMQIILFVLIFPSFVLFGIQGYDHLTNDANLAAKVGGIPITMQQFDQTQREQVARLQSVLGGRVDISAIDTPAMRMRTLDGMINQLLIDLAVNKQHLVVGDAAVQQAILQIPQIAALRRPDGSFDVTAYRNLLEAQGMSPQQFEAQVRAQLLQQQAVGAIGDAAIASQALAAAASDWQHQTRNVRVALYAAKDYAAQVKPDTAALQAFYQQHQADFSVPEQASIEYVVLNPAALAQGVTVTPQQVRAYYDQHPDKFGTPEQRRASHILIALPPTPTAAQVAAAQAKADAIATEVRKDPSRFAELAKHDSQDPGSAAAGGDLGYFSHDGMVKPFADAVFALSKPGQIAGPVRSPYGFHIIELTGIKPAQRKPFDEVRASIEQQLRDAAARKLYSEVSDKFSNKVYEDSRSFADVAAQYHLQVQHAQGVTPTPRAGDDKADPLANARFLKSLFGPNSLRDKRNIAAIEIGPDTLASGRILNATPAGTMSFAQAQDKVRTLFVEQRAEQLAAQAGQVALQQARAGKAQPSWGPAQPLTLDAKGVAPALLGAVFSANADKLPRLLGVDLPGQGYAVVSLDSVSTAKADPAQLKQQEGAQEQALQQAVTDAYLQSLRRRYGVKVLYKASPKDSAND